MRGTPAGPADSKANAMPTTRAANSAADGTPSTVSGAVTATVAANSAAHLSNCFHHTMVIASMLLVIEDLNDGVSGWAMADAKV
ncbi:hypothetical protein MPSYJ_51100 [Mycolicibacterium psychrotolerans]|uniref:Uncharacterized protein n=1 Tax=Mycolicibacterium psychrotolerans TaxID=216929 RepID=A0A7I7MK68_9MYCO|nr:hypothetical protein MPSYJ_51100 [Mycolicibacterium psychrotolerans]